MANKKFYIKVWETEEERDIGESSRLLESYTRLSDAVSDAKDYYFKKDMASVEVINENDTKVFFHISKDAKTDSGEWYKPNHFVPLTEKGIKFMKKKYG